MLVNDVLLERVINLFGKDQATRHQLADTVYQMTIDAYAKVGGIHGSGFRSPDDMIINLPLWKLIRRNGQVVAGSFYKDRSGRKRVASFTDGTPAGKNGLAMIVREDLTRSYNETSDRMLRFMVNQLGMDFLTKYVIPVDRAQDLLSPDQIRLPPPGDVHLVQYPSWSSFFYQRDIGGFYHTKIMFGTSGQKLVVTI